MVDGAVLFGEFRIRISPSEEVPVDRMTAVK
jgi:hypothetical protein